jgi:signal peptidase I
MTDGKQNESVKTCRPWVGVVLSFFIIGTSQFLAGEKFIGIGWFVIIGLLSFGSVFCLASPSIPGDMPAFIFFAITFVLWIIMLVKSYRPIPRFRWIGWMGFIFLFLILSVAFDPEIFVRPFKVPTGSMSPTLLGNAKRPDGTIVLGDRIFVEKYVYWFSKPERENIVAFKTGGVSPMLPENEFFVKRIIGISGDILSIQDGYLFNRGQPVTEPPSLAKLAILNTPVGTQSYLAKAMDTFVVSNDCYFVVGDNTTNSFDSRQWGALPKINIIGKASKIYWPLDRAAKIQ